MDFKEPPRILLKPKTTEEPKPSTSKETKEETDEVKQLTSPIPLLVSDRKLNMRAFDYLEDANNDFIVIGAIGMSGVGKSYVLNLVAAEISDPDKVVFPTETTLNFLDDDGVQKHEITMSITKDRIMLLDTICALTNHWQMDFLQCEQMELRRIMLLLKICHVVIVVQEEFYNINLIRMLICADMMNSKNDKYKSNINPAIVFVKNKCERIVLDEEVMRFTAIYENLFKHTRLKITNPYLKHGLNFMQVPRRKKDTHVGDWGIMQRDLRIVVYMSRDRNEPTYTEKLWGQIIQSTVENFHTNYFLQRYDNLKEKYNLHNHVNIVEKQTKSYNNP